jgi:hypothetical protein
MNLTLKGLRGWCAEHLGRASLIGIACACGLIFGAPASALASGSDFFCYQHYLTSGTTCWGNTYRDAFYETEGWDYDQSGVGNCNGVGVGSSGGNGTGGWYDWACIGDGSGVDQVYCTACGGWAGYGFVHDHSSTKNADFNGWEYFAD